VPARQDASPGEKVITSNRRAFHDYFIDERVEAGIVLTGTEIKSVRDGKITLSDGYARIQGDEAWLENVYVAPYEQGARENPEPRRRRRLLMHRREIRELGAKVSQKGFTLIPLRVYLKGGRAKLELGLARGKHLFDKRQTIADRDAKREIERALRAREKV
jgi:SsrA-binding protein